VEPYFRCSSRVFWLVVSFVQVLQPIMPRPQHTMTIRIAQPPDGGPFFDAILDLSPGGVGD